MTTMSENEPEVDETEESEREEAVPEVEGGGVPTETPPAQAQGGGMDPMSFIQQGGIKDALLQPAYQDEYGNTYSQADLIADIVNVMRLDTKQMAKLHDIDVEVNKMSPEKAAGLLQNMATGEGSGLIDVFTKIEDQRDLILKDLMDEESHEKYMAAKEQMLNSISEPDEVER